MWLVRPADPELARLHRQVEDDFINEICAQGVACVHIQTLAVLVCSFHRNDTGHKVHVGLLQRCIGLFLLQLRGSNGQQLKSV